MPDLVDFIAFRTDWKRKYFVLHQVIMKKLLLEPSKIILTLYNLSN